jgi:hypothetical protein
MINPTFTLSETIGLTLLTGCFPAALGAIASYALARVSFRQEIQRLEIQLSLQQRVLDRGQVAGLRLEYINPLNYWAARLERRISEIEVKMTDASYQEVQRWFQQLKDHADGTRTIEGFPSWCCYEGIFAATTLYFTCSYFQAARQISFRSPFSELDPKYSYGLGARLASVSDSFGGVEGIWDSAQEVVGERFTAAGGKAEYEAMCRIIDSHDSFKYAPLLRPMDVYIHHLGGASAAAIRKALQDLQRFLASTPTPERFGQGAKSPPH